MERLKAKNYFRSNFSVTPGGSRRNIEKVGEGAFGIVNRADWKICETKIALKSLLSNPSINEDNMNKFIKELTNLRRVDFHQNVNRFFGITKEPLSNNYMMVLQYANQGNLREYLRNKFDSLQWNDKIQMALDITRGLQCLHSKEIIHRDLHAKNILVDNNKLMIADLGLSKQLTADVTSNPNSTVYGMPAYIDPQCYKNCNYVRDKKSDIYSLGVLLWEITSGYPPFLKVPHLSLMIKVVNGIREEPITENIPPTYIKLYQKCWDENPDLRPIVGYVLEELKNINNENININNLQSKPKIFVYEPNSNSQSQSSKSTNTDNSICDLNISQIESQINTPLSSISFNENEKDALDEIIQAYLNHTKIGWTKSFDFYKILKKYQSKSQEIFNYLICKPTIQHYEIMIGRFYNEGFGIDINKNIAFNQYMKASQKNNIIGHFEVGWYYYKNNEKNYEKVLEFIQLAADDKLNIALYYLAYFYEFGIDIQIDNFKAFELYKISSQNGFIPAQYELANCYKYGEGTQKNKKKALKWYKCYQKNDGIYDVSNDIEDIEKELEKEQKIKNNEIYNKKELEQKEQKINEDKLYNILNDDKNMKQKKEKNKGWIKIWQWQILKILTKSTEISLSEEN
ncbi:kinase-like domain-containing protein [Glomus cerebriforme]|uniref:Kinase-like domain-containing protein n=1 Tax=Glomus cerebriforme TaxID=658196 RepID=A0A397S7P9_9GLOM|nr:kinase-like domain-containing protein [Glomus cerebriforme]